MLGGLGAFGGTAGSAPNSSTSACTTSTTRLDLEVEVSLSFLSSSGGGRADFVSLLSADVADLTGVFGSSSLEVGSTRDFIVVVDLVVGLVAVVGGGGGAAVGSSTTGSGSDTGTGSTCSGFGGSASVVAASSAGAASSSDLTFSSACGVCFLVAKGTVGTGGIPFATNLAALLTCALSNGVLGTAAAVSFGTVAVDVDFDSTTPPNGALGAEAAAGFRTVSADVDFGTVVANVDFGTVADNVDFTSTGVVVLDTGLSDDFFGSTGVAVLETGLSEVATALISGAAAGFSAAVEFDAGVPVRDTGFSAALADLSMSIPDLLLLLLL